MVSFKDLAERTWTWRAYNGIARLMLALLCSIARADGLGGEAGVGSDDVFRGLSLTDNQPSAQGALHYDTEQWYAGLSAEEVRRGPRRSADAELIAYAAYQLQFAGDWAAALSARHYDYPGNPYRSEYYYDELGIRIAWRQLSIAAIASPDTYVADRQGDYGRGAAYCYELGLQQPLPFALSADAGAGYYDISREIGTGYAYWSAGLARRWQAWQLDLRYIGTDATAVHRFEREAGNRLVLSALWSF